MRQAERAVLSAAVLLAVAGAVGALVFFGVGAPRAEEADRGDQPIRLVPESFPPIERVRIERQDDPLPIVLEKKSGFWSLTSPIEAPADDSEMATFLLVIRALQSTTEVMPASALAEEDLGPFGLDRPFVSLTLEGGGYTHRVFFGDSSPFDRRLFCRAEGGPIVLVDGNARFSLDRRAYDFREKRVLRFQDSMVEYLNVELPDRGYRLERRSADEWHLIAGIEDRADTAEVGRLLALLRGVRAIGFPEPHAVQDLDFENPVLRLEVGLTGGAAPIEIVVAAQLDGQVRRHIARGTGLAQVVELPGDAVRNLHREPVELRYRKVLHFEPERVMQMEIRMEDETFLVHRSEADPSRWLLVSPMESEAERWRISAILSTLATLNAEDIVIERVEDETSELSPLGLAPPQLSVRLLGRGDELLEALEVGSRSSTSGGRYATNAERSRVFTIHEARLTNLPRTLADITAAPSGGGRN